MAAEGEAAKVQGLWPPETEAHWIDRMKNPRNLGLMANVSGFQPYDGSLPGGAMDLCSDWLTVEEAKARCHLLPSVRGFCYYGSRDTKDRVEVYFKGAFNIADEGQGSGWTSWRVKRTGDSGPGRPVGFVHHLPARPFVYGGWFGKRRAPVVFIQAPSRELTDYIRSDPAGPFGDGWVCPTLKSNWTDWGFEQDNEKVWKAEWHTVPSSDENVNLLVPRLGRVGSLRRAPPRIEAFAEAFRAVNREVWSILHDHLEMELQRRTKSSTVYNHVKELANCILDQTHFGVIEAQVVWGGQELRQPSHVDGSTSMLHLSLTLGGSRTLRLGVFPKEDSVGNKNGVTAEAARLDPDVKEFETNVWNEKVWKRDHLQDILMQRGSAYLSSPFCCEHAVKYHRCSEAEPSIALQFRFAFKGDYGLNVNWVRNDDMHVVTKVIAGVLKVAGDSGYLRMPSLEELKVAEDRVQKAAASRARIRKKREKFPAKAPGPAAAAVSTAAAGAKAKAVAAPPAGVGAAMGPVAKAGTPASAMMGVGSPAGAIPGPTPGAFYPDGLPDWVYTGGRVSGAPAPSAAGRAAGAAAGPAPQFGSDAAVWALWEGMMPTGGNAASTHAKLEDQLKAQAKSGYPGQRPRASLNNWAASVA